MALAFVNNGITKAMFPLEKSVTFLWNNVLFS